MFDDANLHLLNPFLRLILMSSEFRLSDLVANFECFKKAFDIGTQDITSFLNNSHFQTFDCVEINSLWWDPEENIITFGSDYSLLSKEEIVKHVRLQ